MREQSLTSCQESKPAKLTLLSKIKTLSRGMHISEFGIKVKKILFGRRIRRTNYQNQRRENKPTSNGKSVQICQSRKQAKWRMKTKQTAPKRAGKAEGWQGTGGRRANLRVKSEAETSRTTRPKPLKRNIKSG